MKKYLPIILILTIFLTFGCGNNSTSESSSTNPDTSIKVTGINITSEKYIKLDIAEASTTKTSQITANIEPADADNKNILYESDDENIALVDANGLITAKNAGLANILVISAANPAIFDTVAVEVVNSDTGEEPVINKVLAVEVNTKDITLDLNEAAGMLSFQILTTIKPEDLEEQYRTLFFNSSNNNIVQVDNTGLVTAKSTGNAVITITAETNPEIKEEINVQVIDTTGEEAGVTSIYLPVKNAELDLNADKLNKTYQIEAIVLPETLEASQKALTYLSSNDAAATVDTNGLITAQNTGNAVITITSVNNPKVTAEFNVQVVDTTGKVTQVTDINVLTTEINLDLTDKLTDTISTEVIPNNADNKILKYTVEPATLATVNSVGFVTAKNTGSGTITIQSESNPAVTKTIPLNITNSASAGGQEIPVQSVCVENTRITIKVGETYQLMPKFTPANTTQRDVEYSLWEYQYGKYIGLDTATGLITAKSVGVAFPEIGIKGVSGAGQNCEIRVQVVDENGPIELTGLSVTPKTLTVNKGDYLGYFGQHISINYEPSTTSEKSVKFISNNPSLLTINESTGIARAANTTGTTTVKVQSVDKPEIYDELTVNIIDPYDKEPPVYNDINPSEMAAHPERMYIKIMFDVTSSTGDIYNDNEKVGIRGIDYTFVENNNNAGTLLEEPANGYLTPYGFCEKYGCYAGRFENISIAQKNAGITYYVGNNGIYTPVKTSGVTNHDLYLVFFTTAGSYYSRHTVTLPIDWSKYDASIHKNAAKFHIIINDRKASVVFDGFENK